MSSDGKKTITGHRFNSDVSLNGNEATGAYKGMKRDQDLTLIKDLLTLAAEHAQKSTVTYTSPKKHINNSGMIA